LKSETARLFTQKKQNSDNGRLISPRGHIFVIAMTRNLAVASSVTSLLQVSTYKFELQMGMPMPMMWGMWVWFLLLAAILILGVIVTVYLSTRPIRRTPSTAPPSLTVENPHAITLTQEAEKTLTGVNELSKAVEAVRPTLNEDERRVLNEIVKAGGEILQSDLPEKSDFSKATVSKLIKSLETMGIITREKHKWTYWVRISDKLISRTKNT